MKWDFFSIKKNISILQRVDKTTSELKSNIKKLWKIIRFKKHFLSDYLLSFWMQLVETTALSFCINKAALYIKIDLRHNIIIVGFVSLAVSQTERNINMHDLLQ
jgi:hypothetical protein